MFRSFARVFASSGIFLLVPLFAHAQAVSFLSVPPLPFQAKNQRATWKFPLVWTPRPMFQSSSSMVKSVVRS